MKFWIDENIPRPIIKPLQRAGHEIFTAPARSSDITILRLALKENAVIMANEISRVGLLTGKITHLQIVPLSSLKISSLLMYG